MTEAEPAPGPSAGAARPRWWRSPHLWVSTTYFAEGFPYAVVNNFAEILFKELGASLQVVGLTSLFHLPWNLKFFWGPFVDGYETKRRWLLATEVVVIALLVLLAVLAAAKGAALLPLAAGFLVLGLVSATHDIAIDGFYMEALDGPDQSRFVGYRAAAYRIAVLVIGGPLVALSARLGWSVGLGLAALIMVALLGYHLLALPRHEQPKRSWRLFARGLLGWRVAPLWLVAVALIFVEQRWATATALSFRFEALVREAPWLGKVGVGGWLALGLALGFAILVPVVRRKLRGARSDTSATRSTYLDSFVSFLAQPRVGVMLAFVILFRTGESFLQKMRWPFFDDVVHLPLEVYGIANGTVGVLASFFATILGGRLIARDGLRRWIWPFVLAQNVLNLLYMGLAMVSDPTAFGPVTLTVIIAVEHIGAGLGTAVFMVYLMRTCDPAHKAGHFAIVSALMSLSFTIAGVSSGFLAEAIGFANYFGFTFLATVPGMLLIFFIPHLDGRESTSTR